MSAFIQKYWFLLGLLLIFTLTLIDGSGTASHIGLWLKTHKGPDIVIFAIFLCSGIVLRPDQIKSGLKDIRGLVIALGMIFLAAPLFGALTSVLPFPDGVKIGIFIVAAMPTTLSSGVVMTAAAGGNMAHALAITVVSNSLSVLTIPVVLTALLSTFGRQTAIAIDKPAIMLKIALFVLLPLFLGLLIKQFQRRRLEPFADGLQNLNQALVLVMFWMAVSGARPAILGNLGASVPIVVWAGAYHALMLGCAGLAAFVFKLEKGRRESVILMGAQKTLVLSIILQVSLFPQYGLALVVCVVHHFVHLFMDGYLVGKMKGAL